MFLLFAQPTRAISQLLVAVLSTAGLSGLLIAGTELNEGREILLHNGAFNNCGAYSENKAVANALDWIGSHFRIEDRHATYYHLDGIKQAAGM